ncbi:MAG TPA: cytochrome c peroxidase [Bryobacteraceae bacterium]|nr:cytochrome c peroxidase [Bryobacteraceae bacterium]
MSAGKAWALKGLVAAAPALFIWGSTCDVPVPLGLGPVVWPQDNPYTPEKAELGRLLFFDKRLSADKTVSCGSCHVPQHAFAEPAAFSTGIHRQIGTRNAPSLLNRAYGLSQFWDGRAATLEDQAKMPITGPREMGNSLEGCVATLREIGGYHEWFKHAFGSDEVTIDRIAMAIATFERTILSGNSPYDRFVAGDKNALTIEQTRGMKLFFRRAKCDRCHEGANFTTNSFHNTGVGSDKPHPDEGRYAITHDPKEWGAFKTPTLRNVAETAPYMHDGSLQTLEDVVEFYDRGGILNKNLDPEMMKPLKLTRDEKVELVAFLRSLSGEGWQKIRAPEQFPQ